MAIAAAYHHGMAWRKRESAEKRRQRNGGIEIVAAANVSISGSK
jgi:hypothetical protein